MRPRFSITVAIVGGCVLWVSLHARQGPPGAMPTLADDLAFLRAHGAIETLSAPGGGQIVLSAGYQGRVMTSAVSPDHMSLGWVNRAFISAGKTGTPFDNYGGEDRFWLGPEAGQYGLYFPAGAPFELASWKVPPILQEGAWSIRESSATQVSYTHAIALPNYSGTAFQLRVDRIVRPLTRDAVARHFGVPLPDGVRWVGFETLNTVTNTGRAPWVKDRGLLSIWILGMFNALEGTTVIVPFRQASGDVVNDRYFGNVPPDRLQVRDRYLLFAADGRFRSKIGIGPAHATSVLGSYSPRAQALTLVHFDRPANRTEYVNSLWERQSDPYGGDVVNSYNDGPPNPGGFYELESSSPALALAPGDAYTHVHRTLHVVGATSALDPIASRALGVPALLSKLPSR